MYWLRLAVLHLVLSTTVMAADPPHMTIDALYTAFRSPPASPSLSPYWFWNGKITGHETRRQLEVMAEQGVQSATVLNWAGLEPAYLSEEWWHEVGVCVWHGLLVSRACRRTAQDAKVDTSDSRSHGRGSTANK